MLLSYEIPAFAGRSLIQVGTVIPAKAGILQTVDYSSSLKNNW